MVLSQQTGSSVVNRQVTYNYFDSSPQRPVWTVGSLARTMWKDSAIFGLPHATEYDASTDTSFDVIGNTEGRTSYYEHETGTDQNRNGTITAITSNIESGDFDITQAHHQQDNKQVLQHLKEMVNFL